MKEIVKTEVLKLLKAIIIYSKFDSRWIGFVLVVSEKGGMSIVKGEEGDMIAFGSTGS